MAPPMMCKPNNEHKTDSSVLWESCAKQPGGGNKEGSCLHPITSLSGFFTLNIFG